MRITLVVALLFIGLIGTAPPTTAQAPTFSLQEFSPEDQTFAPPPSAGENAVILAPGQTLSVGCPAAQEGSGVLCAPQFAINVSAAATGVVFESVSQGEFIVFFRFGSEVGLDGGRAVFDSFRQSQDGRLRFSIPNFQPGEEFPGLQPGQYFFAVAHFETTDQQYTVSGGAVSPQTLRANGSPVELACGFDEFLCAQQFKLDASQLAGLQLTAVGEGDFLLLVRAAEAVALPPLTFNAEGAGQIRNPVADFTAEAADGRAEVRVDAASAPPLRPGAYYVALFNLEGFDQRFTLTAASADGPGRLPPEAGFSHAPDAPRVGEAVAFTDASQASGGRLVDWAWAFGDGETSAEQNPVHRYAAPGTYRVSLTVTSDTGLSDSAQDTVTVLDSAPPAAPAGALSVIAFAQLSFETPEAWTRTVENGCALYTNVSEADAAVRLVTPDGQTQTLSLAPGRQVLVCGNAAHFD